MNIKKCTICGEAYDYCGHCKSGNSWKYYACSQPHFQIFVILREVREGIITEKEAGERLKSMHIKTKILLPSVAEVVENYISKTKTKADE